MFQNKYSSKISSVLAGYGIPKALFDRTASTFLLVSTAQIFAMWKKEFPPVKGWKEFLIFSSVASKLFWMVFVFICLSILYRCFSKRIAAIDSFALIFSSLVFSLSLVFRSGSFYLGAAAAAVAAVLSVYSLRKIDSGLLDKLKARPAAIIVFSLAAFVAVFIALTTVANHLSFGTSCFDMGIFVQTFNSLKENLTATVTCERGELMSHFQVHASYIFYLFLPIYALFPKGETLLIAQAVFTMAGVLPFYLIVKRHGFKGVTSVCACLIYVFNAGLIMPCYYQFHENAFLPTILMWLLYAADSGKIPLFYIMSLLTCIVKEDAPLYVICIGLFFAIENDRPKRKHGIIAAALATVYFILIMNWLTNNGDGEFMTASRFGILMAEPTDGFLGIIKNVFLNPGYLISLMLQEKTLLFFTQTMLPFLFLPFITDKLHRFLLMIPYIVMNLVIGAGYGYAANIGFQYIFGPSCLLIYLALINAEKLPKRLRNNFIIVSAIVTLITTVSMASVKVSEIKEYKDRSDHYRSAIECIQSVPKDACVLSNTFLLPHAADRAQVYELFDEMFIQDAAGNTVGMEGLDKYDYCILSQRDPMTAKARPILEASGWKVYAESEGNFVIIFVKE